MKKKFYLLFMVCFFLPILMLAERKLTDDDINLYQSTTGITQQTSIENSQNSGAWQSWIGQHGKWNVSIDAQTNTPLMAFGKPISVKGFNHADDSNAEAIAMNFLLENAAVFNIDTDNLKLQYVKEVLGKWYVSYVQIYGGYQVLNSEVSLRINKNAEVFAFKMSFYNEINLKPNFIKAPVVKPNEAITASTKGMEIKKDKQGLSLLSATKCESDLYILPVKKATAIDYHLIYKTAFTADGLGKYSAYVDANTGEVLQRKNQLLGVASTIKTNGMLVEKFPIDPEVSKVFSNIRIPVGNEIKYTDTEGNLSVDIDEAQNISFELEGKYANVKFTGTANSVSTINYTLEPGDNIITFDDSNTNKYERFAVYHIQHMHDWMLNIDPSLTCLEDKFTVTFYEEDFYNMGINAFSEGYNIGFTMYTDSSAYLGQAADVLYHEYGHSVNTNFYRSLGTDMENTACNEALADLNAALAQDFHGVGYGVWADDPDRLIRDLKNTNTYPEDIIGEGHHDSQILSGAFWDLREMTSVDYVAHLSHFCRYGLPDDPDTGVAFSEWFLESLIVDDDNGDLSDGTPNYDKILESFNNHKIGLNLLAFSLLTFEVIPDNLEGASTIDVVMNAGNSALPIELPETFTLVYSDNNFNTSNTLTLHNNGENSLTGQLAISDKNAFIRYYLMGEDNHNITHSSDGLYDFCFATGYTLIEKEDFENADNITITNSDDVVNGFKIGEPIMYGHLTGEYSITADSYQGSCLMTDVDEDLKAGSSSGLIDLMNLGMLSRGSSEVITKDYDISQYDIVGLSFFMHNLYADSRYGMDNNSTNLTIAYSFDGSENWNTFFEIDKRQFLHIMTGDIPDIYNLDDLAGVWRRLYTEIDKLSGANTIRFRIKADIASGITNGIACSIDEFMVWGANDPVGIQDENVSMAKAYVYPNPSADVSYVDYFANSNTNSTIAIYSLEGNNLFNTTMMSNQGNNTINLNTIFPEMNVLPAGTYFVRINTGTKIETAKLIKL